MGLLEIKYQGNSYLFDDSRSWSAQQMASMLGCQEELGGTAQNALKKSLVDTLGLTDAEVSLNLATPFRTTLTYGQNLGSVEKSVVPEARTRGIAGAILKPSDLFAELSGASGGLLSNGDLQARDDEDSVLRWVPNHRRISDAVTYLDVISQRASRDPHPFLDFTTVPMRKVPTKPIGDREFDSCIDNINLSIRRLRSERSVSRCQCIAKTEDDRQQAFRIEAAYMVEQGNRARSAISRLNLAAHTIATAVLADTLSRAAGYLYRSHNVSISSIELQRKGLCDASVGNWRDVNTALQSAPFEPPSWTSLTTLFMSAPAAIRRPLNDLRALRDSLHNQPSVLLAIRSGDTSIAAIAHQAGTLLEQASRALDEQGGELKHPRWAQTLANVAGRTLWNIALLARSPCTTETLKKESAHLPLSLEDQFHVVLAYLKSLEERRPDPVLESSIRSILSTNGVASSRSDMALFEPAEVAGSVGLNTIGAVALGAIQRLKGIWPVIAAEGNQRRQESLMGALCQQVLDLGAAWSETVEMMSQEQAQNPGKQRGEPTKKPANAPFEVIQMGLDRADIADRSLFSNDLRRQDIEANIELLRKEIESDRPFDEALENLHFRSGFAAGIPPDLYHCLIGDGAGNFASLSPDIEGLEGISAKYRQAIASVEGSIRLKEQERLKLKRSLALVSRDFTAKRALVYARAMTAALQNITDTMRSPADRTGADEGGFLGQLETNYRAVASRISKIATRNIAQETIRDQVFRVVEASLQGQDREQRSAFIACACLLASKEQVIRQAKFLYYNTASLLSNDNVVVRSQLAQAVSGLIAAFGDSTFLNNLRWEFGSHRPGPQTLYLDALVRQPRYALPPGISESGQVDTWQPFDPVRLGAEYGIATVNDLHRAAALGIVELGMPSEDDSSISQIEVVHHKRAIVDGRESRKKPIYWRLRSQSRLSPRHLFESHDVSRVVSFSVVPAANSAAHVRRVATSAIERMTGFLNHTGMIKDSARKELRTVDDLLSDRQSSLRTDFSRDVQHQAEQRLVVAQSNEFSSLSPQKVSNTLDVIAQATHDEFSVYGDGQRTSHQRRIVQVEQWIQGLRNKLSFIAIGEFGRSASNLAHALCAEATEPLDPTLSKRLVAGGMSIPWHPSFDCESDAEMLRQQLAFGQAPATLEGVLREIVELFRSRFSADLQDLYKLMGAKQKSLPPTELLQGELQCVEQAVIASWVAGNSKSSAKLAEFSCAVHEALLSVFASIECLKESRRQLVCAENEARRNALLETIRPFCRDLAALDAECGEFKRKMRGALAHTECPSSCVSLPERVQIVADLLLELDSIRFRLGVGRPGYLPAIAAEQVETESSEAVASINTAFAHLGRHLEKLRIELYESIVHDMKKPELPDVLVQHSFLTALTRTGWQTPAERLHSLIEGLLSYPADDCLLSTISSTLPATILAAKAQTRAQDWGSPDVGSDVKSKWEEVLTVLDKGISLNLDEMKGRLERLREARRSLDGMREGSRPSRDAQLIGLLSDSMSNHCRDIARWLRGYKSKVIEPVFGFWGAASIKSDVAAETTSLALAFEELSKR